MKGGNIMNIDREKLAELCHEQWSGWMKYLFSQCTTEKQIIISANGNKNITNIIIPSWAVERWMRQMKTEYQDLSEAEKRSDRREADKFIRLLQEDPDAKNN